MERRYNQNLRRPVFFALEEATGLLFPVTQTIQIGARRSVGKFGGFSAAFTTDIPLRIGEVITFRDNNDLVEAVIVG